MQVRSAMPKRKKFLLVGDEVEVRQLEEGLRGSWQTGHVIEASENARVVRYNHFVDEDGITNYVERIAVSGTIDGPSAYAACGYRGKIRPSVPPDVGPRGKDFWYGLCVDAWYEDGWWEGVLFDNKVGSGERSVFFPDEGDELRFNVDRLRLTRDWNEASGTWTARGTWAFLALVNKLTHGTPASAPLWIKQLWYNLRTTDGFLRRISEWTLGEPLLWRNLMKQAISDHHLVDSNNNIDNNAVAVVSTGEENLAQRRRVSRWRKPPFSAENVHEQHGRNCGYVGNVQRQVVIVDVDERGEEKQTPVEGIVCSGEQEACPSSGHYEELEARSTVQPSPASEQKNEALDQEYGRQLIAEYIRLVDERTKSKAAVTKGLLDRVRLGAKMYLLTKGWVFEHEEKCGKRELHYFSPEGKRFYSFYTACSALQREERPCPEKAKYQFVYKKGLRRSSVQLSHSATAVFTGRECIVVPSAGKRCAAHKEGTEASKSFVSCSSTKKRETSISDNKNDKDQSVQLCKKRVPTISKSPEFRTQPHSDVSAATSLANTKDTQQICFRSCPVPAEKPSNERLVSAGSNDERLLDKWKRKRGKHPKLLKMEAYPKRKVKSRRHQSDSICSVCHYGGLLILCDQCPSSFHLDCVNLKIDYENIEKVVMNHRYLKHRNTLHFKEESPKGKWFCPCCRCSICGSSDFSDGNGEFSELAVLYCDQCEREYHVRCWGRRERQRLESFPIGNWFCSRKCSKVY